MIQVMQRPFSLVPNSKNPHVGITDLSVEELQNFVNETFEDQKIKLWLAPSQGLYLHNLYFDNYNRRGNILESLELVTEEESSRTTWCEDHIIKYVKEWARGDDFVATWLGNNINWDTLERIQGIKSEHRTTKEGENEKSGEMMVETKSG